MFDTGFHSKMASHAFMYAVPLAWYKEHHVRKLVLHFCLSVQTSVDWHSRYGFHGTSHQYVVTKAGEVVGPGARVVSCHLGAGCSLAAALTGERGSRDTSMGFSPLSGLMMGTRSGDIDPSILPYISQQLHISPADVLNALNKQSGFLGIAGTSDSR